MNLDIKCPICNYGKMSEQLVLSHMVQKHNYKAPLSCEKYKGTFGSKDTLKKHLRICKLKGKIFHCEYCNKGYNRKEHLRTHVREKHTKDGDKLLCHFCGKSYTNKKTYKVHYANATCTVGPYPKPQKKNAEEKETEQEKQQQSDSSSSSSSSSSSEESDSET